MRSDSPPPGAAIRNADDTGGTSGPEGPDPGTAAGRALRARLEDIARTLLHASVTASTLIPFLPEPAQTTALEQLTELDAAVQSLRTVLATLPPGA
jgi:hypothetical protein